MLFATDFAIDTAFDATATAYSGRVAQQTGKNALRIPKKFPYIYIIVIFSNDIIYAMVVAAAIKQPTSTCTQKYFVIIFY